jgi:hypothetical protein
MRHLVDERLQSALVLVSTLLSAGIAALVPWPPTA